nr:MAG TPA: II RNA helicase NPH-II [Caudoviricetes sp.]
MFATLSNIFGYKNNVFRTVVQRTEFSELHNAWSCFAVFPSYKRRWT